MDGDLLRFLGVFVGGLLAFIAAIIVGMTAGSRHFGRIGCENWSAQTGIETKFVVLNFASSGTCLARTQDGKWLQKDQLREFVNNK